MDEDSDLLPDHTSSNKTSGGQKMDLSCSEWKSEVSKVILTQKEGERVSRESNTNFSKAEKQTPLIDEKPMLPRTMLLRNKWESGLISSQKLFLGSFASSVAAQTHLLTEFLHPLLKVIILLLLLHLLLVHLKAFLHLVQRGALHPHGHAQIPLVWRTRVESAVICTKSPSLIPI